MQLIKSQLIDLQVTDLLLIQVASINLLQVHNLKLIQLQMTDLSQYANDERSSRTMPSFHQSSLWSTSLAYSIAKQVAKLRTAMAERISNF